MRFFARLIQILGVALMVALAILLALLIIAGFILLINRGLQFLGNLVGYEVGDFFSWLRSKLPRKKRKKNNV